MRWKCWVRAVTAGTGFPYTEQLLSRSLEGWASAALGWRLAPAAQPRCSTSMAVGYWPVIGKCLPIHWAAFLGGRLTGHFRLPLAG